MTAVREVTCEFCNLPIRPGEEHGVIAAAPPGKDEVVGEPRIVCRIKKVVQTIEEIPAVAGGGR
jgi:hypothetical protein